MGAMQRVHLIDNASAGEIHQRLHPFDAWSGRLCIKVQLAARAVTLNREGRHRLVLRSPGGAELQSCECHGWWHSFRTFLDKKRWQIHKTWFLKSANSPLCAFSVLSLGRPAPPHARPHICRPTWWSFQEKKQKNADRVQCDYRRCFNRGRPGISSSFFVVILTFENITD